MVPRKILSQRLIGSLIFLALIARAEIAIAGTIPVMINVGKEAKAVTVARDARFTQIVGKKGQIHNGIYRFEAPSEGVYHWRANGQMGSFIALNPATAKGATVSLRWSGAHKFYAVIISPLGQKAKKTKTSGRMAIIERVAVPMQIEVVPYSHADRPIKESFNIALTLDEKKGATSLAASSALTPSEGRFTKLANSRTLSPESASPVVIPEKPAAGKFTKLAASRSQKPQSQPPINQIENVALDTKNTVTTKESSQENIPALSSTAPAPEPLIVTNSANFSENHGSVRQFGRLWFLSFYADEKIGASREKVANLSATGKVPGFGLDFWSAPTKILVLTGQLSSRYSNHNIPVRGVASSQAVIIDESRSFIDLAAGIDLLAFTSVKDHSLTVGFGGAYADTPVVPLNFVNTEKTTDDFEHYGMLVGGAKVGYVAQFRPYTLFSEGSWYVNGLTSNRIISMAVAGEYLYNSLLSIKIGGYMRSLNRKECYKTANGGCADVDLEIIESGGLAAIGVAIK